MTELVLCPRRQEPLHPEVNDVAHQNRRLRPPEVSLHETLISVRSLPSIPLPGPLFFHKGNDLSHFT
jgi:hypothetical protein